MRRDEAASAWRRASSLAAHVAPAAASTPAGLLCRCDASAAPAPRRGPIVLIGGAVMDLQAWPSGGAEPAAGTTVPGEVRRVPGGVARNIAAVLRALPCAPGEAPLPAPLLVSVVGDDADGAALLAHMRSLGLPTRGVRVVAGARTATVAAVFGGNGDIAAAVADCGLVEEGLTVDWVSRFAADVAAAPALLLDANAGTAALAAAASLAVQCGTPLWLEPVSVAKARRCVPLLRFAAFVSPNAAEAAALAGRDGGCTGDDDVAAVAESILAAGCAACVTTLGPRGALLSSATSSTSFPASPPRHALLPAAPVRAVVSTAGAGDALVAGALAALARGASPTAAIAAGLAAAAVVVARPENAPPQEAWPPAEELRRAADACFAAARTLR